MKNTQIKRVGIDTVEALDKNGNKQTWWTRQGYMKELGLSINSLNAPYHHVRDGKAEKFNFFSISFFRPL